MFFKYTDYFVTLSFRHVLKVYLTILESLTQPFHNTRFILICNSVLTDKQHIQYEYGFGKVK